MPTVLSTKILSAAQKNLLLNSGIGLVEYNAISITLKDFPPPTVLDKNLIFTSKNAIKAVFSNPNFPDMAGARVFCVGEKTRDLLQASGLNVVECESYGSRLAEKIVSEYSSEDFIFFCGNKRREELPGILKTRGIALEEIEVYTTSLTKKTFGQEFDGVLFYSPSGVESYSSGNDMSKSTAFCIGETTAEAARKHTAEVVVANKQTIENLLIQVVKHIINFRRDLKK